MFGLKHIGKIVLTSPPGKTPCSDGSFSTLPQGRGVCSQHKGLLNKRIPGQKNDNKTTRLQILETSLLKKQAEFDEKLQHHFDTVKQANGQPLNDKKNGPATLKKWDQQNQALRNLQDSIAKTERAIEIEKYKISNVEGAKKGFPQPILDMLESGQLIQWRKHPNTFFVKGVDKARIVWDEKDKIIFTRYKNSISDPEVWRTFAKTFNTLLKQLSK